MERNECVFPEFLFRFSNSRDIGLALLGLVCSFTFHSFLSFLISSFFFRSISLSFRTQLLSVDSFFLNRNIVHSKNGNIFNLSFSLILILFLLLFSFSLLFLHELDYHDHPEEKLQLFHFTVFYSYFTGF